MRIDRQSLPSWRFIVLVTLAAMGIATTHGDDGYGWPFIAGHFVLAWLFIGAFGMLGRLLIKQGIR